MNEEMLLTYRVQRLEDVAVDKADVRDVERVALALERYTSKMDTLIEKHDLRIDELERTKADVDALRWLQRTAVGLLLSMIGASVGFGFVALTQMVTS